MIENELRNLLHEAAGDAMLSSTTSRQVLRRTRLRMAMTGALMVSVVVLIAGVGFALATRSTEGKPKVLESAQSTIVTAPEAPESDLVLTGNGGILLAEVQEGDNRTWTFSGIEQKTGLCLNSTTHTETSASGAGECVDLGVPQDRYLGFLQLDAPDQERYEVLGAVSTDVRSLDFENESGDRKSVTIIDAPDELGIGRNFFYLWLPRGEQGVLEVRGVNEEVLQKERLCLPAKGRAETCSVGEESTISASRKAAQGPEVKELSCSKKERSSELGEMESGMTPREAIQEWLDKKNIHSARPADFAMEQVGPGTRELSLSFNGDDNVIVAITTFRPNEWRGEQWKVGEVAYCPDLIDP
jgi:hypothetical protein